MALKENSPTVFEMAWAHSLSHRFKAEIQDTRKEAAIAVFTL